MKDFDKIYFGFNFHFMKQQNCPKVVKIGNSSREFSSNLCCALDFLQWHLWATILWIHFCL